MRKNIFEIENRLDINLEYKTLLCSLFEYDSIYYNGKYYRLYDFIDEFVFNLWDDRGTFCELDSYCKNIGLYFGASNINEDAFLNFLELMLNLFYVLNANYPDDIFCSLKVKNIFNHNIPIILEKLNYKVEIIGSRRVIAKRDSDVDSVLDIVPNNIATLLLEYNDIRNNNIESKKSILKKIDLYLESDANKKKFKSYDSKLWDSIGTVVNKMGINHPIIEEPYLSLTEQKLINWYDKCFRMMIHLIRCEDVIAIKGERDLLVKGGTNND